MKVVKLIVLMSLIFLTSGCANHHFQAGEKADPETEGFLLVGINASGVAYNPFKESEIVGVSFKKYIDGQQFYSEHSHVTAYVPHENMLLKFKPGEYSLGTVSWIPAQLAISADLVQESFACMGKVKINAGEIVYAGDFHLNTGDVDRGFFVHTIGYQFGLEDSFETAVDAAKSEFPKVSEQFVYKKRLLSPWTCHEETEEDEIEPVQYY
ncbi:hypothetical protein ACFSJ3_11475 [Corallincola platygyrae]|uniref:Lipoprotein n=1 Tax=Corallincola platygyrae TaxID=1193278 RepID=A0ABW4XNJ9_9GAMM